MQELGDEGHEEGVDTSCILSRARANRCARSSPYGHPTPSPAVRAAPLVPDSLPPLSCSPQLPSFLDIFEHVFPCLCVHTSVGCSDVATMRYWTAKLLYSAGDYAGQRWYARYVS